MSGEGLSPELLAGIARYRAQVESLGGYGTRVAAIMPNGVRRVGALAEAGFGGCQPMLVDDAGKRWRILTDLDEVEVV